MEPLVGSSNLASATAAIETLANLTSPGELREYLEANSYLVSDNVIGILSRLGSEAGAAGDRFTEHNLGITRIMLTFAFESKLREDVLIPTALQQAFVHWDSMRDSVEKRSTAITSDLVTASRRLIDDPEFANVSTIKRRDVLRVCAEMMLQQQNESPNDAALDDAIRYFSTATDLCPTYSLEFARLTGYGGIALMLRYSRTHDVDSLQTAILILRHALANSEYNPQAPSEDIGIMLAKAYVERFELHADRKDLKDAAETLVYSLRNRHSSSKELSANLMPVLLRLQRLLSANGEHDLTERLTDAMSDLVGG